MAVISAVKAAFKQIENAPRKEEGKKKKKSSGKHRSPPFRVTLRYQNESSSSWHRTSDVLITPRGKRYAKDSDAHVVVTPFNRRSGRQLIMYENSHVFDP